MFNVAAVNSKNPAQHRESGAVFRQCTEVTLRWPFEMVKACSQPQVVIHRVAQAGTDGVAVAV